MKITIVCTSVNVPINLKINYSIQRFRSVGHMCVNRWCTDQSIFVDMYGLVEISIYYHISLERYHKHLKWDLSWDMLWEILLPWVRSLREYYQEIIIAWKRDLARYIASSKISPLSEIIYIKRDLSREILPWTRSLMRVFSRESISKRS